MRLSWPGYFSATNRRLRSPKGHEIRSETVCSVIILSFFCCMLTVLLVRRRHDALDSIDPVSLHVLPFCFLENMWIILRSCVGLRLSKGFSSIFALWTATAPLLARREFIHSHFFILCLVFALAAALLAEIEDILLCFGCKSANFSCADRTFGPLAPRGSQLDANRTLLLTNSGLRGKEPDSKDPSGHMANTAGNAGKWGNRTKERANKQRATTDKIMSQ